MRDFRSILYILGLLLCIEAIAMIVPLCVDLIYSNEDWQQFFYSSIVTFFIGLVLFFSFKREKIKILQNADEIFIEQLKKKKLYNKIWQAFTVLLPVKTIGVMGDQRSYEYTCVLRAVTSVDGMTAEPYYFNSKDLTQISTKIINEVKGVNRVVYDHTSKPPGTIEWE